MTPQEINIEIAKVCGWKLLEHDDGAWSGVNETTRQSKYRVGVSEDHAKIVCFPDYHGDLNAMHEAEKVLTATQKREYRDMLCIVCGQQQPSWHATAAQRAEAFLRTLNLWRNTTQPCN